MSHQHNELEEEDFVRLKWLPAVHPAAKLRFKEYGEIARGELQNSGVGVVIYGACLESWFIRLILLGS